MCNLSSPRRRRKHSVICCRGAFSAKAMWLSNRGTGRTQMDQSWLWSMTSPEHVVAVDCLERLRSETTTGEFGYKIQALAAHVLLRQNHRVLKVNQKGHPDIVSVKDGQEFRFEVEAEVIGSKKRMLTSSDFEGLIDTGVVGYFALAVSFPRPYWVLAPARRLKRRNSPAGNALLEALSDKVFSSDWTSEYLSLIGRSCREILDRSFDQLVRRAIDGRAL